MKQYRIVEYSTVQYNTAPCLNGTESGLATLKCTQKESQHEEMEENCTLTGCANKKSIARRNVNPQFITKCTYCKH